MAIDYRANGCKISQIIEVRGAIAPMPGSCPDSASLANPAKTLPDMFRNFSIIAPLKNEG